MSLEKKPSPSGTADPGPRRLAALRALPAAAESEPEDDPARPTMLRARNGDLDAFRTLIEMFQDRVFRVVTAVLRCDRETAEDMCQEVFLRVHRGLPGFDGQARFSTWLHTVTMNVAITEYRKRKAQKRDRRTISLDGPLPGTDDLQPEPAGHEREPAAAAHDREFLARVRECVQQLPDDFRSAVVLRDMEGLSYEEVASILDIPPGTVRSRIHRGRLLLQDMLRGFDA